MRNVKMWFYDNCDGIMAALMMGLLVVGVVVTMACASVIIDTYAADKRSTALNTAMTQYKCRTTLSSDKLVEAYVAMTALKRNSPSAWRRLAPDDVKVYDDAKRIVEAMMRGNKEDVR